MKTSIADHTGTGSGTGGDDFLIQEFSKNVSDPNYTVLFAETLDGVGLGMTIIAWSGSSLDGVGQSYWQSLRVAQASRGRGIASLLFKLSARFAIERQGPKSVARWGIVSNNSIMMNWSQKVVEVAWAGSLSTLWRSRERRHGGTAFWLHDARRAQRRS